MMFLSLLLLLIFPLGCCYCYCVRSNSTTTTTLHDDIPVRGVSDRMIVTNHVDDLPSYPSINERVAVDEEGSRMISLQTYTNFHGTHAVEGYSSELAVAEIILEGQEMISDHHFILTPLEHNCQRARYPTDVEIGSPSPAPDLHADIIPQGDEMISDHHFLMTSSECQRAGYPTDEELGSFSPVPDFDARIVHL